MLTKVISAGIRLSGADYIEESKMQNTISLSMNTSKKKKKANINERINYQRST